MEGRRLMVSTYPMPPYVSLDHSEGQVVLRGFLGEIWKVLEDTLKFTSDYVIEDFPNGVQNIQNGKCDILLRPIVIDSADVELYDFTVPLISSWYQLYVKDSEEVNSSYSYVRNWSASLWISTVAVVIGFALLLFCMLRVSRRYLNSKPVPFCHSYDFSQVSTHRLYLLKTYRTKSYIQRVLQVRRGRKEESLGNCFMAAIANLCSQGCYTQTKVSSVRILVLSYLMFAIVMYNSYSALLISQLTLQERYLPFQTLDDLATIKGSYALCVREQSASIFYFRENTTSPVLKEKWAGVVNKKPCLTKQGITSEVMCASHVVILESPAVMKETVRKNTGCRMRRLKGKYVNVDISVVIARDFDDHAKGQLNKHIMRLRELGILNHLAKKWIRQDEVISPAAEPTIVVSYDHIEGVMFLYSGCLLCSLSLLIVENMYNWYRYMSKKK